MSSPAYVIAASVERGNRILRFHGSGRDSAAALLMDIPRFRWGSFDIAVPDEARPGPDDSWEVGWPERKLLRLYKDGTLLFRGAANQEFLGWGQEPEQFEHFPRINPVAAVEVHASFAHFYARVMEHLKSQPERVHVKVRLSGGAEGPSRLFLTKYYENIRFVIEPTRYVVHSDPAMESVTLDAEAWRSNPNRAGYLLFSAFASLFDFPEEEIPFIRDGDEGSEIDLEAIKAL